MKTLTYSDDDFVYEMTLTVKTNHPDDLKNLSFNEERGAVLEQKGIDDLGTLLVRNGVPFSAIKIRS